MCPYRSEDAQQVKKPVHCRERYSLGDHIHRQAVQEHATEHMSGLHPSLSLVNQANSRLDVFS